MNITLMRPTEVATELGKRLQEQRINKHMTQADLARHVGVSLPTISNLENGKNTALQTVIKVVFALGLEKELQTLFKKTTQSIAELEQAQVRPKRVRASAKRAYSPPTEPAKAVAPQTAKDAVKEIATGSNPPTPGNPRLKELWDKNLLQRLSFSTQSVDKADPKEKNQS